MCIYHGEQRRLIVGSGLNEICPQYILKNAENFSKMYYQAQSCGRTTYMCD
jgi:hypothetical protein